MSAKNLLWVGLVVVSLSSIGCGGKSDNVVTEGITPVMTPEESAAYDKANDDYQRELSGGKAAAPAAKAAAPAAAPPAKAAAPAAKSAAPAAKAE